MTATILTAIIQHIKIKGPFSSFNSLKDSIENDSIEKEKICSKQTVQNYKEELLNQPCIKHTKTKNKEGFEYVSVIDNSKVMEFFEYSNRQFVVIDKQCKMWLKDKRNKKPIDKSGLISGSIFMLKRLEQIDSTAKFYYIIKSTTHDHKNKLKSLFSKISDLKIAVQFAVHKIDPETPLVVLAMYQHETNRPLFPSTTGPDPYPQ